ncbi:MAG: tetratricopeptide repeat protein [Gallionella sp.]
MNIKKTRIRAPSPAEFDQLVVLYNTQRYAELESRARSLVEQYPGSGFTWKLLGASLQMQGKNALSAFQKTAALMPNDAEAHFNLGVVLKGLGQLDDAVLSYRRALKLNPGYAEAHSNLGNALKDLGQLDNAVASFSNALKIKPDSATAHNSLGAALKELGQLDKAVASYRRAVTINPNYADAHYNLGNVLKDFGHLDDAVTNYRRAVEIKHDFAEAHNNLGAVLKELGHLDAAVASYRQAVEINPNFAEAHNNLGAVLIELGQLEDAVACLRRSVELKADYADAHYNLGNALQELGQIHGAMTSYRRVLMLKPDSAEAHNNLGSALRELGQFDSAIASYHMALKISPDSAIVHSNLGHALKDLGQLDDALASYHRALKTDPKFIGAMLGISYLCELNGDVKETEEVIRKILEIKPDNLEARYLLANIRKTQADDENLAALLTAEEAAQNSRLPVPYRTKVALHFALGKCFDDLGDHDRAFPHFIEGCKLKRATFNYDATRKTQLFNEVIRVFDHATIERLRSESNPSRVPIFVLGMPRSGTTLTEQIIASHPEVYGAGELPDMQNIANRDVAGAKGFPGNILAHDPASLTKWADDYVASLRQRAPDARHITDKLPGNFWFIGLIHVMLPKAKIIHVNRNPVDTCLSCFTKLFNSGHEQTYDMAELGRYYVDYARLMNHWRAVLPAGAFLDVQYEDIVADQEAQARHMIKFCNLEWNDACLDFHKSKRAVDTASMTQVRRPIYTSSVERWRPYEKYLGPLLEALGDLAPKQN